MVWAVRQCLPLCRFSCGRQAASRQSSWHDPPTTLTPMTDREAGWTAVHDATPEGWYVGRPYFDERHDRWEQYAFDQTETPSVGKRSRQWVAIGQTELHCVQEMARCLGKLKAGRWPSQAAIAGRPGGW